MTMDDPYQYDLQTAIEQLAKLDHEYDLASIFEASHDDIADVHIFRIVLETIHREAKLAISS